MTALTVTQDENVNDETSRDLSLSLDTYSDGLSGLRALAVARPVREALSCLLCRARLQGLLSAAYHAKTAAEPVAFA